MSVGKLTIISGKDTEKSFLLKNLSVFEAGRSPGNHVLLNDPSVAMSHFRICQSETGHSIYDLGSRTGTQVNGEPTEKAELLPGDVIQAGEIKLQYELVDEDSTGQLASSAPALERSGSAGASGEKQVVSHGSTAYLRVVEGEEKGKAHRLIGKKSFNVGRSNKSDIRLRDGKVSREHCVVEKVGDHFIVTDKSSANGTVVNGENVRKTVLKNGDYVRLGHSILRFGYSDGFGSPG